MKEIQTKQESKSQSNKNKSPRVNNHTIKEEKVTPKATDEIALKNSKEKTWKEDIPTSIPQPERSLMNKDFDPYI